MDRLHRCRSHRMMRRVSRRRARWIDHPWERRGRSWGKRPRRRFRAFLPNRLLSSHRSLQMNHQNLLIQWKQWCSRKWTLMTSCLTSTRRIASTRKTRSATTTSNQWTNRLSSIISRGNSMSSRPKRSRRRIKKSSLRRERSLRRRRRRRSLSRKRRRRKVSSQRKMRAMIKRMIWIPTSGSWRRMIKKIQVKRKRRRMPRLERSQFTKQSQRRSEIAIPCKWWWSRRWISMITW